MNYRTDIVNSFFFGGGGAYWGEAFIREVLTLWRGAY